MAIGISLDSSFPHSQHLQTDQGCVYISRLPAELEREIFEIAASISPESILSFVLLARRFRIWFEPELYRIIRSGEDGRVVPPPLYDDEKEIRHRSPARNVLQRFKRAAPIRDSKVLRLERLRQFGPWVNHILLQNRTAHEIKQVLEACPNVSNLALWIIHGSCTPLISTLENLPQLNRLSFDPTSFFVNFTPDFSVEFDQPMFRNLTHLEIINVSSSWTKWRQLALLPKLTHLALANVADQTFIDRILNECALLEVFVMFYMDLYTLGDLVSLVQKDPRVVLLLSVVDHLAHWEDGARGGTDFWVTAERKVALAKIMKVEGL
ncbi:hypothetical protein BDN70DRAFT_874154 [Pholiota conissans]|uniref:F-box domain-containing protein n=1 Tax=Pholiota conissans TaxID=109636 RepID=A0A9P5ZAF8_9AGAR|nr:hypothetical protein BDN70DRAFT_874154 [Pholiota conissans]